MIKAEAENEDECQQRDDGLEQARGQQNLSRGGGSGHRGSEGEAATLLEVLLRTGARV